MFYLHIPEYKQEKIKMRASYFGRIRTLLPIVQNGLKFASNMVLEKIMSDIQFITRVGKNQTSGAPRGQKRPFRPREVWAIRARLEMLGEIRNLALLNLAIDSKLRGCDLVRLKVSDVFSAYRDVLAVRRQRRLKKQVKGSCL